MKHILFTRLLCVIVIFGLHMPAPVSAQSGRIPTQVSVSASPSAPVYSQSVTLYAVVSENDPNMPTGVVNFYDGGAYLGSGYVNQWGLAMLTVSGGFSAGRHNLTVQYPGDGNFEPSTSAVEPVTVGKAGLSLTLTSITPPSPALIGETVTAQFHAVLNSPAQATAAGVEIMLMSGEPGMGDSCRTTLDANGDGGCSLTAWPGDPRNPSIYVSTSSHPNIQSAYLEIPYEVSRASTTTSITGVTPASSVTGAQAQFSASVAVVSPGSGTPTGSITISNGFTSCTADAPQGTCALTFAAPGSYTITASYTPDVGSSYYYNPSTATSTTYRVEKGATTTQLLSVYPAVWQVGDDLRVYYQVLPVAPAAGTFTGDVTVSGAGGSCTAPASAAYCTLQPTVTGVQVFEASYAGSDLFNGSTAAPFTADYLPGPSYVDPAGLCDSHMPCYTDLSEAVAETWEDTTLYVYPGTYPQGLSLDRDIRVDISGKVILEGDFVQTNGVVKAPPQLFVRGRFEQSGGSFDARSGRVVISPPENATLKTLDPLYDLDIYEKPMLAYYPLEQAIDLSDVSGNGRDGSINMGSHYLEIGAPTAYEGSDALALLSLRYVHLPVDIPEDSATIAFWFYHNAYSADGLFEANQGGVTSTGYDRNIYFTADSLCAAIWNQVPYTICASRANIPDLSWHHLVYRYGADVPGHQLIIDNVVVASDPNAPVSAFTWQSSATLGFGRAATDFKYFYGFVDDARIYGEALTLEEVDALYRLGSATKVQLTQPLDVNGSLHLYTGRLDVSADNYAVNVEKNWTTTFGVFEPRAGTVTLDGQTQYLNGWNDFYNLTKITPGGQLNFAVSVKQIVNGLLTLKGAPGQRLKIMSDAGYSNGGLLLKGSIDAAWLDITKVYGNDKVLGGIIDITGTNSVRSDDVGGWNVYAPVVTASPVSLLPGQDSLVTVSVSDADPAEQNQLSLWLTALPCAGRIYQANPDGSRGAEITADALPVQIGDASGRVIVVIERTAPARICPLGFSGSDGQVMGYGQAALTMLTDFTHWQALPLTGAP